MVFQTETRYCSYCSEDTTHELPDEDMAPDAICRGCNKAR